MDLRKLTIEERFKLMEERQTCFSLIAVEDTTLDAFVERLDFYFATIGMGVFKRDKYVEIHIQLTKPDYEKYFIIPTPEGRLDCSKIVQWNNGEDDVSWVNIETHQVAYEKDILVTY